jgi:DNA-binding SARP family transcriptional activator/tetratricopeptide (TPR) repeat protein
MLSARHHSKLVFYFLGSAKIEKAGVDITVQIKYRKGIALLGYLAVNSGSWLSRDKIADLFWPSLDHSAARTNLRQVLNNLSKVINDDKVVESDSTDGYLCIKREQIGLFPGKSIWIDLSLLEAVTTHISAADASGQDWIRTQLEPLLGRMSGEFLESLNLAETPDFEDWIYAQRENLRRQQYDLLKAVSEAQLQAGRIAAAIVTTRQMAILAPLNEDCAAYLMTLLAQVEDYRGALNVYATLKRALRQELNALPGSALRQLSEQIGNATTPPRATIPIPPVTPPTPVSELRWVTLVCCGLTPSAEAYPEEILQLIANARTEITNRIKYLGGRIISQIGGVIIASFGSIGDKEQAGRRAFFAAQQIIRTPHPCLLCRIGVCAGQVLLQTEGQSLKLDGLLPDLAQRLSWVAEPGEIVAEESVVRQNSVGFRFQPLDKRTFRGLSGEFSLHLLLGQTEENTPGVSPDIFSLETYLVGRTQHLTILNKNWQKARGGQPRTIVLQADPGMGKTRLAREFAQACSHAGHAVLWLACRAEHQQRALSPVSEMIERLSGIRLDDDSETRLLKTGAYFDQHHNDLRETTRQTIFSFIGESSLDRDTPVNEKYRVGKTALFAAILDLLGRLCARSSTLLVLDDMHWADQSTLELLAVVAREFTQQRVMLVITTRPEAAFESTETPTIFLDLPPLTLDETRELIEAHDNHGSLPPAEREQIVESASGVPLFIERITRSRLEGAHQTAPITELMQMELDRMGRYKSVLQTAAVLGIAFDPGTLSGLLPNEDISAVLQLATGYRLVEARPDRQLAFRHALIRDTAYNSIPPAARQQLHGQIAALLKEKGDVAPAVLAAHFDAARQWPEAIQWWQTAGRFEMAGEFAADALIHFQRAFQLSLQHDPTEEIADRHTMRLDVGMAAMLAQGYGSPLAHQQFTAVLALGEKKLDQEIRFAALSGLYMGGSSQGELQGIHIARKMEILANTDPQRLMVCFALGNTLFWMGEFQEARHYQEQGIRLANLCPHAERVRYCMDDPAITCRALLAWNLWFLGEPENSLSMMQEGLSIARSDGLAHERCFILTFAAFVNFCLADTSGALPLIHESLALAARYNFSLWAAVNTLLHLWVQASTGELKDSSSLMKAVTQMQQAYGAGTTTARWITTNVLFALGDMDQTEALLELTLNEADIHEDLYCIPDLLRLQGECLLRQKKQTEAHASFRQARSIAKKQGSAGWLSHHARQNSMLLEN